MPLESTIICLDNSEFMRNGDYSPTRLDAQQDAGTLICLQRINDNPESTVGILSMASKKTEGRGVELLVAPTTEQEKILASFAGMQPTGTIDFCTSVQIAQLALKHRVNKQSAQRIIAFVGSPIVDNERSLSKIGKQLAKNNIAVDVVIMGEHEENHDLLKAFVEGANKGENSHLVVVPPGVFPCDAIRMSPIMNMGGGGDFTGSGGSGGDAGSSVEGGGGGGGGMFAEYGGIDPALDPELAMVMRESLMMERAAAEARAKAEAGDSTDAAENAAALATATSEASAPEASSDSSTAAAAAAAGAPDSVSTDEITDEEALALAAKLSLESPLGSEVGERAAAAAAETPAAALGPSSGSAAASVEGDEDEDVALALALSMQESRGPDREQGASLLASVGLDANDPLLAAAMAQLPPAPPTAAEEEKAQDVQKAGENSESEEPASKRAKEDQS